MPTKDEHKTEPLACLEVWGGNEPVDTALAVPGLQVWVYAVPFANAAAGGDVHFVSSCGTGRIARLLVADVAGHGEAVADTARTLRGLIRRFMNHIDQRQFVAAMNRRFTELAQTGRFATAVAMTYFSPSAELSICNAGHPPPLRFRQATGKWSYLESTAASTEATVENLPLGVLSDSGYEQFSIELAPGDLVLCYTDSLIESVCRDGSLLGAQRLLELLQTIPATEPTHIIHHLVAKLAVFGATINDDVTLLLARCSGSSKGAGFSRRLLAQLRFVGQVVTFRPNVPWPEFSWRNLGGAIFGSRPRNRG
jgi:serine phosphatase RsbU (regulator of sigma subunit)